MSSRRDQPDVAPATLVLDINSYAELKRRVAARGLLDKTPRRYFCRGLTLLGSFTILAVAVMLTRYTWCVLFFTLPAAFLFGQLGFMAHDATHNQILRTSGGNYALSVALFNLTLGGSRGWWANKHNAHHANPNQVGTDPDIQGGVIALTPEEVRGSHGIPRLVMRHQASAIGPILSLSALQMHVYSLRYLFTRPLRHAIAEAVLFAVHWVLYLTLVIVLMGPWIGLLFALAHQMWLGVYLGAAFLPNHIGMPTPEAGDGMDFLHRQVLTSRNLHANRVTDYVFGALSCQIEHHLFPTMPRYRLREAAEIVRPFCRELGVAYKETGVLEAYREVHRHLRTLVLPLRQYSHP